MRAEASSGRTALITGLTGQDGSFLAELLLEQSYRVVGMIRGEASRPLGAAEHLRDQVELVRGDLLEPASLTSAISELRPDELYHLAAPTFVPDSWREPAGTQAAIVVATAALLDAVRSHSPHTRTFVAVSSTVFGATSESPQREDTPCHPQTPYATAKLAAHQLVGQFRNHERLHACSGILYNHESERRPSTFVTRKITRAAAAIKLGLAHEVVLGDLTAARDWSFAGDIVRGGWMMLQREEPRDYILASGVLHTVREFAELAFSHVGLDARNHVRTDPGLMRAPDAKPQVGDRSRAGADLGWEPIVGFQQLVARMVDADLRDLS